MNKSLSPTRLMALSSVALVGIVGAGIAIGLNARSVKGENRDAIEGVGGAIAGATKTPVEAAKDTRDISAMLALEMEKLAGEERLRFLSALDAPAAATPPSPAPVAAPVDVAPVDVATIAGAPATPEAADIATMAAADLPMDDQLEMMSRVPAMIKQGDIAGARVVLARLDRSGNSAASFALAQTYDPAVLNAWNVRGIKADPAKALELYQRALEGGVGAARERLAALAAPGH